MATLIQESNSDQFAKGEAGGWQRMKISLHMATLYSQESRRWSLVSSKLEQKGQDEVIGSPHAASLERVGKRS